MFGAIKFVLHNCRASLCKNECVIHEDFHHSAFEDTVIGKTC